MIPPRLLPHQVTRVRPVALASSAYGTTWDYGASAGRSTFAGWLEQADQSTLSETVEPTRATIEQRWNLITNYVDIDANDRIEWPGHPAGMHIFDVDGPPEPAYTPRGPHHTECRLRRVEG